MQREDQDRDPYFDPLDDPEFRNELLNGRQGVTDDFADTDFGSSSSPIEDDEDDDDEDDDDFGEDMDDEFDDDDDDFEDDDE
jgi:hypothetical protein